MNPPNDLPQSVPPENILLPETITDEQLAAMAPVLVPNFWKLWNQDFVRLSEALKAAATGQDGAALETTRQELKDRECWISRWNGRWSAIIGETASEQFIELELAFRNAGDDILAAVNAELPGQGEGEEWKRGE